jgi:glutathione S-transferase
MSIILYNHEAGSTSSQKVRLCLHYKGLDYESVNIDLHKHQNQGSEYLKINRHGLVPTLIHNKNVIKEANLINEYLDRVFKEKPLLSQDPLLLYQIQYLCKKQEYINEHCLRYLSYKYSGRVSTLTTDQIENHPQLDRRRFLRTLRNGLPDKDVLEIEHYLVNELEHLNKKLSNHDWLCGSNYTLADLSWTVLIYRLDELGKINLIHDNKLDYLIDWYTKVRNMDNFVVMHI